MPASEARTARLWRRAEASIVSGSDLETFGGLDRFCQDHRVVDFGRDSGRYVVPAYTTAYDPVQDPDVLGEFVAVFSSPQPPQDADIVAFYARFGRLGDKEWQDRLPDGDRGQLPEGSRLGSREPVWWLRERARELELCCLLYSGLADHRIDVLRSVLGRAPSSGMLVQVMMLAGEIHRPWASEEDLRKPVGPFGLWTEMPGDEGREFTPEECFAHARAILTSRLNHYEARVHRKWRPRADEPLTPVSRRGRRTHPKPPEENPILTGSRGIEFPDLLSCLYLKLSDAIAEQRLLRRCPSCQRFFHPDRPNQEYCRTRCSTTYRRRKFAAKHKPGHDADAG